MRLALLGLVLIAACQQAPAPVPVSSRAKALMGADIAQRHCANCHAIGRQDSSPHPEAPLSL